MKLLFFPVVLWSLFIPDGLAEQKPGLRPALLLGGITGTLSIPVLFYTYSGILGRTVTGIDISTFFISVTIAFLCAYHITDAESVQKKRTAVLFLTVLFLIAFSLFTFFPPDIGLFADP